MTTFIAVALTFAFAFALVESGLILSEGSRTLRAVVFTLAVASGAFIPWAIGKAWIGFIRNGLVA